MNDNRMSPWIPRGREQGAVMTKKKTQSTADLEQLMNSAQVSELLDISPSTLKLYRSKGMPFVRVGRLVKFRASEVNQWLQQRTVCAS